MKPSFCLSILFSLIFSLIFAQSTQNLQIVTGAEGETIILVDDHLHDKYGLAFPLTYEMEIPAGSQNFRAVRKYSLSDNWEVLEEKTSEDFFNGIEVVRFDYENQRAYISIGFHADSDTLFIAVQDEAENQIEATCLGPTLYYDNRQAAVTSTADDWAAWSNLKFLRTIRNFRDLNLWLSTAIVSDGCEAPTWVDIQTQLDSGYVEAISHSRTHPTIPYNTIFYEVAGSRSDIVDNLELPPLWRKGEQEYVYGWVAPYGQYNEDIAAIVSQQEYLVTRMYYGLDHDFPEWDPVLEMFHPVGVSREVGPLWLGTPDSEVLNATFDQVVQQGGIYHVMCHPNVIEWEEDYTWEHLTHISNHKNIWYVGFGHLYVYHLLQYPAVPTAVQESIADSSPSKLQQNYPNPFDHFTTISYRISESDWVELSVFDAFGKKLNTLVNQHQGAGSYQLFFEKGELPAGIYFFQMKTLDFIESRKMVVR